MIDGRASRVLPPGVVPFGGGLVRQEVAREVVSPPYDALTPAQRAEVLGRYPRNYLSVLRRAEDVPGMDHLVSSRSALERLLADDVFEDRLPSMYVCRLAQDGHVQDGIVVDVPLAWADEGRILGHEQVRAERAAELAAHLDALRVTSSPVVFAHRRNRSISTVLTAVTAQAPLRSFTLDDGLTVVLWAVADREDEATLRRCLDALRLYITDGHHRVEAARRHRQGREDEPGPHQHVLGALFAEDQLRVEPFHRIALEVRSDLASRLAAVGHLQPTPEPPRPHRQGTFGVALDGSWYRLDVPAGPDELAPSILQRAVLSEVLGIDDPTRDPRLLTVPGTTEPTVVGARAGVVGGAAFLLHPVSVAQLMVTADQGRTLPPKSTYFVPKMRSGIFLRRG